MLTQIVQVPKLIDGAKHCRKFQPCAHGAPTSQTDRQTDRQRQTDRR